MGLRGPGRTPTKILKARGSPLGRRRAATEPPLAPGDPAPPRHLPKAARAVWQEVVTGLSGTGLLAPVDALSLATYCRLYARWLEAEGRLEREGQRVEVDTRGGRVLRRHPAASMALSLAAELRQVGQRLGLNPSARSGLYAGGSEPGSESPFPAGAQGQGAAVRSNAVDPGSVRPLVQSRASEGRPSVPRTVQGDPRGERRLFGSGTVVERMGL